MRIREEELEREMEVEMVERPVVFLQHGLMASSADWVLSGPGHALAYQLWEAGYDVWLGNFRGNTEY